MPKKMGINTKAAEAKARKDSAKRDKEDQIQKKKEEDFWRDDDKLANRKLDRQNDREKKRLELAQRKAQNKAALEEETSQFESSKASVKPAKVTRSQIQSLVSRQAEATESAKRAPTHIELDIQENTNRDSQVDEARNIDQAISILSINEAEADRHPERRVKAAYAAFEELHLPRLKQENPNLRLSQLKQMLKKDWMKSPDNPMNQRTLAFNTKT